jgi:DNA end-binding protein Ku
MLIQLRFADEVNDPAGLNLPEKSEYSKQELEIALSLIEHLERHFNAKEYADTYTDELKKIIAQKAKGEPIRVSKEGAPASTDMRNLMEMLKRSLEEEKRKSEGAKSRP